jgi:hypothetical protein
MQYLIPYLIPAMLTFLVGIALWAIKRQRKGLEYEIIASEPFPHGEKTGKYYRYYVIRLRNSGNVAVQDTRFRASFEQGLIESSRWSDPSLVADISTSESTAECIVPLLNPRERIALTITAIGDHVFSFLKVEARAIGVTATEKRDDSTISIFGVSVPVESTVTVLLILGILTVLALEYYVAKSQTTGFERSMTRFSDDFKKRTADLEQHLREESQGQPDSGQIIFAILNRAGVGHLSSQLVATSQDITYWGTGLVLVNSFLLDQANSHKYVTALEELVKIPMAASSLGFNLYLLSKLERFRGNTAKADNYLEQCKQETPLMYQHLMQQDQYFDLRLLQKQLQTVHR